MDKKFVKKVIINNFITILFESFFIALILNNFFSSIFDDFWINYKMLIFIGLINLSIILVCSIIFSFRYNFNLIFKYVAGYYLLSFFILDLFLSYFFYSVFNNSLLLFLIVFLGLSLINVIISLIDFKWRKLTKWKNK